jgi:hypothetical protein
MKISLTTILAIFLIALHVSCKNEPAKIPLESIDDMLEMAGNRSVTDILASFESPLKQRYLLNKGYIAPMLHGRMTRYRDMYNESYQMISPILGKISDPRLVEITNNGVVKSLSYSLKSSETSIKDVILKIDINFKYGLSDYYLYVTSTDGFLNKQNVLPEDPRKT